MISQCGCLGCGVKCRSDLCSSVNRLFKFHNQIITIKTTVLFLTECRSPTTFHDDDFHLMLRNDGCFGQTVKIMYISMLIGINMYK